jgi:hypothetical protein
MTGDIASDVTKTATSTPAEINNTGNPRFGEVPFAIRSSLVPALCKTGPERKKSSASHTAVIMSHLNLVVLNPPVYQPDRCESTLTAKPVDPTKLVFRIREHKSGPTARPFT